MTDRPDYLLYLNQRCRREWDLKRQSYETYPDAQSSMQRAISSETLRTRRMLAIRTMEKMRQDKVDRVVKENPKKIVKLPRRKTLW